MKLNKPIFIGQCVLDQSKYLMNDFHYNKMLPYFTKDNLDLLFTDTDSLCYHIKNKDPFEYMQKIRIYLIYQIIMKVIHYMSQEMIKLLVNLKMKQRINKLQIL